MTTKSFYLLGFLPQETDYRKTLVFYKIETELCENCQRHYSPTEGADYELEVFGTPLFSPMIDEEVVEKMIREQMFPNVFGDITIPCNKGGNDETTGIIICPKEENALFVISDRPEYVITGFYQIMIDRMDFLQLSLFKKWAKGYSERVKRGGQ